jgi:hypothetical protein
VLALPQAAQALPQVQVVRRVVLPAALPPVPQRVQVLPQRARQQVLRSTPPRLSRQ